MRYSVIVIETTATARFLFLNQTVLFIRPNSSLSVRMSQAPVCRHQQCSDPVSPCPATAACFDTQTFYVCGPYAARNLTLLSGPHRSLNPLVLGSTRIGQTLSMQLNLGNTTAAKSVSVATSKAPLLTFPCASFSVLGTARAFVVVTIRCALGPGVGANLSLVVSLCHPSGICLSARSNQTFSFPPPTLVNNSLHIEGSVNSTASLLLKNSLLTRVAFAGLNLFGTSTSEIAVSYGPGGAEAAFVCTVVTASDTSITCDTQANSFGQYMRFLVRIGGQSVLSVFTISFPSNIPRLLYAWSPQCPGGVCPTAAVASGVVLTLTGDFFDSTSAVFVDGESCAPTRNVSKKHIECYLRDATGPMSIVISSLGQFSAPLRTLFFALPSVSGISGCNSAGPLLVDGCNRAGGQNITITGSNFVSSRACSLLFACSVDRTRLACVSARLFRAPLAPLCSAPRAALAPTSNRSPSQAARRTLASCARWRPVAASRTHCSCCSGRVQ
jgi:hypothetical protein